MDTIEGFSQEAYQVAEAVVIRSALSDYIVKIAKGNPDHELPEYKMTIQFLTMLYKKYNKLASTQVELDASGRYVVKRDLRGRFDLN